MTMRALSESDDSSAADRISLLLFMRKMSQSALARARGYSVAGVSRRKTGATEWGFAEMREVARVLDTSAAFLAGETDDIARPDHLRTNDESPAAFATGDSDTVCAPRDSNPRPSDP